MKRFALYVALSKSVEVRLRVEADCARLTIKGPGAETEYRDIPQGEVAGILEQFLAIRADPEKFKTCVCVAEANFTTWNAKRTGRVPVHKIRVDSDNKR